MILSVDVLGSPLRKFLHKLIVFLLFFTSLLLSSFKLFLHNFLFNLKSPFLLSLLSFANILQTFILGTILLAQITHIHITSFWTRSPRLILPSLLSDFCNCHLPQIVLDFLVSRVATLYLPICAICFLRDLPR